MENSRVCCFDPFGKVSFGNVKTQTLKEIWNSALHQSYLRAHVIGQGQTCALCNLCTEG